MWLHSPFHSIGRARVISNLNFVTGPFTFRINYNKSPFNGDDYHYCGGRNGAKFTKFIFIHIQHCYCYSRVYLFTFNNRIYIQEIYLFILPVYFLFTIIFAHIYEMSSFTFNVLYAFTLTIEIFIQHFLRTTFMHHHSRPAPLTRDLRCRPPTRDWQPALNGHWRFPSMHSWSVSCHSSSCSFLFEIVSLVLWLGGCILLSLTAIFGLLYRS